MNHRNLDEFDEKEEFDRPEMEDHRRFGRCERRGPHGRPMRRRPPLFDPSFIENADTETLIRICAHDLHRRNRRFGESQDRILKILSEKECISQRRLQEKMYVRPGSISELISKMEEKGLLISERKQEDRRHVILKITEEGKKAASEIVPAEKGYELRADEEETLKTLLKKMIASLHEHMEKEVEEAESEDLSI